MRLEWATWEAVGLGKFSKTEGWWAEKSRSGCAWTGNPIAPGYL